MLKHKFKTLNLIASCLNHKSQISPSLAYLIKANDVALLAMQQEISMFPDKKLQDISTNEWMLRGLAETQFNISSALLFLNNLGECMQFLIQAQKFNFDCISKVKDLLRFTLNERSMSMINSNIGQLLYFDHLV